MLLTLQDTVTSSVFNGDPPTTAVLSGPPSPVFSPLIQAPSEASSHGELGLPERGAGNEKGQGAREG